MTISLYAAILALLMMWLVVQVVKTRRKNQVKYADGGVDELIIARSAHANAAETIPIGLILMALLELNDPNIWLLHIPATAFVAGRIIHCQGILADEIPRRKLGMHMTVWSIVALAILNLIYLPYDKFMA